METINLSESNSVINSYLAELRDREYQRNRLLFRNNIMRIGELMAYEISKRLDYKAQEVTTPMGVSTIQVPSDDIVLATILRAGLPFHNGFLNIFDHAGKYIVPGFGDAGDLCYGGKE